MQNMRKKVVVAGAGGFIGKWFIDAFHEKYDIIALTRSEVIDEPRANVEWRVVDLYSRSSTENALRGADFALYLVHSMSPSARMNQSNFEDTDLLLADNFAVAAEKNNLKQIIFVGGILPKDKHEMSLHLRSRLETEQTLASRKTPLTALRAGLVIGPGGSSFLIVQKLTERLPVMACPQWCKSLSQPVDIRDILQIIDKSLGNTDAYNREIEIGGTQKISYMNLLKITAQKSQKKRLIFSIPFFTLGFSKLWVRLFSGADSNLISPLIESLCHDMVIENSNPFFKDYEFHKIEDSIDFAIHGKTPFHPKRKRELKEKNTVRSVQRLPNPSKKSAIWVAEEYPRWLSRLFSVFFKAFMKEDKLVFTLFGIELLQLKFISDRSDVNRQLFYIVGGMLVKRTDYGWLEFRSVLENQFVIAAIHEFVPSLPWPIYKYTQAVFHLWVMTRFSKFLSRQ